MRYTHLQSATGIVEMGGTRVLTDPWLVQGEYYGSWYHYPPCPVAPEDLDYDWIYVSHIHPDHMSRKTFERLDRSKPVLIHRFEAKFLKRNIESLGFEVIELDHGAPFDLGGGTVEIFAADDCNPELCQKFVGCAPVEGAFRFTQIDSLAVFTDGDRTLLNTNDCPFELSRTVLDRVLAKHPRIDLLLTGYAGAGPFPQCFAFSDDARRRYAAGKKREQFLNFAASYIDRVDPEAWMPFAGTYVLGGRLRHLNADRGVPPVGEARDAVEAKVARTGRGILLDAGAAYDLGAGAVEGGWTPTDLDAQAAFLETTAEAAYDYDDEPAPDDAELAQMMDAAWPRFRDQAAGIGLTTETRLSVTDGNGFARSFGVDAPPEAGRAAAPMVEITVDRRLLGRLLKGPRHAHWNNAEIGSHLAFRRDPDEFERGLYYCLSAFHA